MRTMRVVTSGTLIATLVALGTAGEAVAAKKKLGRYYGGTTSDGAPFVLELARNGKAVQRVVMMARPDCADGDWAPVYGEVQFLASVPPGLPLGAHAVAGRKVSKTGRFRASGFGIEDYGPNVGATVDTISGKVRRNGTASGSLSIDVTVKPKDSEQAITTCSTGELRWTARSKRGVVFTGQTDQSMPVVLELNAQRNAVSHLRFGWGADCSSGGGIFVPDDLTDIRAPGGAFDTTIEQPFSDGSGGFSYRVTGRTSGPDASGDVAPKLTLTDPAGAVTTCEAGTLGWSARSG